jgi:hypothetical protein
MPDGDRRSRGGRCSGNLVPYRTSRTKAAAKIRSIPQTMIPIDPDALHQTVVGGQSHCCRTMGSVRYAMMPVIKASNPMNTANLARSESCASGRLIGSEGACATYRLGERAIQRLSYRCKCYPKLSEFSWPRPTFAAMPELPNWTFGLVPIRQRLVYFFEYSATFFRWPDLLQIVGGEPTEGKRPASDYHLALRTRRAQSGQAV